MSRTALALRNIIYGAEPSYFSPRPFSLYLPFPLIVDTVHLMDGGRQCCPASGPLVVVRPYGRLCSMLARPALSATDDFLAWAATTRRIFSTMANQWAVWPKTHLRYLSPRDDIRAALSRTAHGMGRVLQRLDGTVAVVQTLMLYSARLLFGLFPLSEPRARSHTDALAEQSDIVLLSWLSRATGPRPNLEALCPANR